MEKLRCLTMSRNVLLEKIKQAEAVASAEVEKAEKEHVSTTNRIPLDQEAVLKEKREKAEKASQSEIDKAILNGFFGTTESGPVGKYCSLTASTISLSKP